MEQFIKWRKKDSLTPFYESLTKNPSALHIHHKSAPGLTHEDLVSFLCSLHANPQKLTQEHASQFYHQCLPRQLESSGLTISPFFKSVIKDFDHFEELVHNIGYEKVHAFEDFELEHNPDDQWKKACNTLILTASAQRTLNEQCFVASCRVKHVFMGG